MKSGPALKFNVELRNSYCLNPQTAVLHPADERWRKYFQCSLVILWRLTGLLLGHIAQEEGGEDQLMLVLECSGEHGRNCPLRDKVVPYLEAACVIFPLLVSQARPRSLLC